MALNFVFRTDEEPPRFIDPTDDTGMPSTVSAANPDTPLRCATGGALAACSTPYPAQSPTPHQMELLQLAPLRERGRCGPLLPAEAGPWLPLASGNRSDAGIRERAPQGSVCRGRQRGHRRGRALRLLLCSARHHARAGDLRRLRTRFREGRIRKVQRHAFLCDLCSLQWSAPLALTSRVSATCH